MKVNTKMVKKMDKVSYSIKIKLIYIIFKITYVNDITIIVFKKQRINYSFFF